MNRSFCIRWSWRQYVTFSYETQECCRSIVVRMNQIRFFNYIVLINCNSTCELIVWNVIYFWSCGTLSAWSSMGLPYEHVISLNTFILLSERSVVVVLSVDLLDCVLRPWLEKETNIQTYHPHLHLDYFYNLFKYNLIFT